MFVKLTVYRDQNSTNPTGSAQTFRASDITIWERDIISLVDTPNMSVKLDLPTKLTTRITITGRGNFFVGETPEEIQAQMDIQAGMQLIVEFVVGDAQAFTPIAGTDEFPYAPLDGLLFKVFTNGIGWFTLDVQYELLTGGGIRLLPDGNIFSDGEYYAFYKM